MRKNLCLCGVDSSQIFDQKQFCRRLSAYRHASAIGISEFDITPPVANFYVQLIGRYMLVEREPKRFVVGAGVTYFDV